MRRRGLVERLVGNRALNGLLALALIITAVVVSYSAENGLPFVPTYDIKADIPDAAQLTKNSDVRIGGSRVGQVLKIQAMPPARGRPPFARLSLSLDASVRRLPVDTIVRIRLGSLLGGEYIELVPGHSRRTIPPDGRLGLSHAQALVALDQALRLFDPSTGHALQGAIGGLGDAVAGRGTSINDAISSTSQLLPPLERVLGTLDDPRTRLARFVDASAATMGTLGPVAPELANLVVGARATFSAFDTAGGSLGETIDALPRTESTGTVALRHLEPVLANAAAVARGLAPAAPLLVPTTRALDRIVLTATPVAGRIPAAATPLETTLHAARRFATDPATEGALRVLGANDLGSLGESLFLGLGAILRSVAPAQLHCNAASLWMRNLSSSFSEGDASGTWIRMLPILEAAQSSKQPRPATDLHFNPYPNENASECEAGNEPYVSGQQIGNPSGQQARTTAPTGPSGAGR
jgi:virulence factor Mce-like protein